MWLLMFWRKLFLIYQVFYIGFEIQLKPEKRKSIVNLLRGEDVIVTLPTGYRKSLIFHLYIIAKSKLATWKHEQGLNISYSCLVICPLESIIQDQIAEATSLGIAAMKLDDDFKNNTSKHAHLLFATYGRIRL